MGLFAKLFDTIHVQQAVYVRLAAYVIDLRSLPADARRALRVIDQVAAQIDGAPEAVHVWLVGTPLLEAFQESYALTAELGDALCAATRRAQSKMIVDQDAPASVVRVLCRLGFEVSLLTTA
jgi:hypothetical protein